MLCSLHLQQEGLTDWHPEDVRVFPEKWPWGVRKISKEMTKCWERKDILGRKNSEKRQGSKDSSWAQPSPWSCRSNRKKGAPGFPFFHLRQLGPAYWHQAHVPGTHGWGNRTDISTQPSQSLIFQTWGNGSNQDEISTLLTWELSDLGQAIFCCFSFFPYKTEIVKLPLPGGMRHFMICIAPLVKQCLINSLLPVLIIFSISLYILGFKHLNKLLANLVLLFKHLELTKAPGGKKRFAH